MEDSPDLDTAFFDTMENVNNPVFRFRFDGKEEKTIADTETVIYRYTAEQIRPLQKNRF